MIGNHWSHFSLPTRIHLEPDSAFKVGNYIRQFGDRALLFSLKSEFRNASEYSLLKNGVTKHFEGVIIHDDFDKEPDFDAIDSLTYFLKKCHANVVIAYGGRVTANVAKTIALLATNPMFCHDLITGKTKPTESALPVVFVPSGLTIGEELLCGVSLRVTSGGERVWFEHESLAPAAVFYDSQIAGESTGDEVAKAGGAILACAIESQLSPKSGHLSSVYILRVIDFIKKNLQGAYNDPRSERSMTPLFWGSAMTGMAMVSSPMGVAWSVASALADATDVHFHDGLCIILPHVMDYYLTAAPNQFVSIARSLGEDVSDISVIEAAIKAVEGVRRLFQEINLPTKLSEFDVRKHQMADIAARAMNQPHLQNAPRQLSRNDVESILLAAF